MEPLYFNFLGRYVNIQTTDLGYFFLFLALNVALSSISWFVIEKPINNLKKYFRYINPN